MNLSGLAPVSVKDIAEELTKLNVKELEIPKFAIPNWPPGVVVSGYLGKRDYRVPVLQGNNLLQWRSGRHKIFFWIDVNGIIGFRFDFTFGKRRPIFDRRSGYESDYPIRYVASDYEKNSSRLAAVILFDQFKVDILLKILPELKINSKIHNQVIEEVQRAFEPFIPFVVLDQLTS